MTRTGELFVPLLLRSSPSERDGQTTRYSGAVRRMGTRAPKQRLAFLRESVGRHEKLGHHRLESVAFERLNRRNLQGLLPHAHAGLALPPSLRFKTGHHPAADDGSLKILAGIPLPRPSLQIGGWRDDASGGEEGRTRDPENGQSWGSRKREKEDQEGRKATVKIF